MKLIDKKSTPIKYDEPKMLCLGLTPTLNSLDTQKKVKTKLQMQQILFNIQVGGMGNSKCQCVSNFNKGQCQGQHHIKQVQSYV